MSRAFLFVYLMLVVGACSSSEREADPARHSGAQSSAGTEGAVCGMVVSEQPAPRAQVVHRDGTRLHLCGITDLLVHLDVRSPHGEPTEIYVEAMEIDEDPREVSFAEHEWIRAEDAIYRIGDERPRLIMGEPVMVYRDRPSAERAMAHGPTTIFDFDGLQAWSREQRR